MAYSGEQICLFDEIKSDFPCDNCVFDRHGVCTHLEDAEFYCVRGSFQITPEQALCPKCGARMEIVQDDKDSDGGRCKKCGTCVIFHNQGNRKSAFELWKTGRLIGE